MIWLQLRICPTGLPTLDVDRKFDRVPCIGELVDHRGETFRIVDVVWHEDEKPLVVAHSLDRPRAQAPFA